ncbi:YppG family protein [Terribacillus sp. 179-K 1B1 HS]|uniref:YppG family protein n=1 Tax=Terribacillus sp. 179-K 1B1 HS TaxID=3142388 RepID=UPI00399FC085
MYYYNTAEPRSHVQQQQMSDGRQRYYYEPIYQTEPQEQYKEMYDHSWMQANGNDGNTDRQTEHYTYNPYPPEYFTQWGGWQQQGQPQQPVTPYEYFKKPPLAPYWHAFAQPPNVYQPKQQAQLTKGLASYFQDKNGQMDINKMMSTVGQMASTVQQVSPIVKSLGSFLKILK